MKAHWLASLTIITTISASPIAAQAVGDLGVVFQVPVALGVIWHPSERVAIRPEVSYSATTSAGGLQQNSWTVAVNAPFYLSNHENVRAYISPRVGYSRTTNQTPGPITIPSTTNWTGAGSFGVQYSPTPRISLYGENGISYSSITTSSNSHSWAPRSALGLILYIGK
jgi:hypothetical protein